MGPVIKGVSVFLALIYPLAVYFGLNYFEPRYLAIFLGLILLLRIIPGNSIQKIGNKNQHLIVTLIIVAIIILALINNSLSGLKLYPAIISFSLLSVFGFSLFKPPTTIERIARLQEPDLSEKGVIYTREVTKIWCVFLFLNGCIALYTAFYTSLSVWTLYNGLISYLIMGSIFVVEMIYRKFHLKV